MDSLFTIFIFLLTLSILIIVHEYGHYRVAKWCGVKVLRFSIGFGKPFLTWKVGKDQTEFALAPFLLGGYVRMLDSREKEVPEEEKGRDFNRKPLIQRALIVFAGPAANFLLAIVFLAGIALFSAQNYAVKIDQPVAGSALAQTGIGAGDEIVGISIGSSQDVKSVQSWMKLFILLQYAHAIKENIQIQYKRPNGTMSVGNLPIKDMEGAAKSLPRNLGFNGMWHPARLSDVVADGVADKAGLKAGDRIKSINGELIHDARELLQTIQGLSVEVPADFSVERGDMVADIKLMPYRIEVPVIAALDEQDPAYLAGLREGDVVIGMNNQLVADSSQLNAMLEAANQPSTSEWMLSRKGQEVKVQYATVPVAMTVLSRNKIDVMLGGYDTVDFGFFESMVYGVDHSYWISRSILTSVGQMFAGKVKVQDNLSGPIEIATIASQSAQRGISDYVLVLIQISISLAILNLLPLPVLDGGHLFLYMIEAVRGKPLPDQWIGLLQRIGIFLLLALMLFVTFNDILRRV